MNRPNRMLLVEDSPDDAELVLRAIQRGGIEPVWKRVETADELRVALTEPWDVVLSDYTLPGFGATAALKIIRAIDQDLPVLIVSGTVGEEVAVSMIRAGANDYVLKNALVRLVPAIERELREAENRRAKRAAEQLGQDVLDSLDSHVAVLDASGTIIRVNTAWTHFAAANAAGDLARYGVGVNYLDVCERATGPYAEEAAPAGAGIRRVLRGESPSFTLEYPCHSATEDRWFQLFVTPLRTVGRGAVVSHVNISDRKRAELATRRLATIVESSQDAIISKSLDGVITSWNPAAEKLYGWSANDAIGRHISFIVPADKLDELSGIMARVRSGHRVEYFETVRLHRDGRRLDIALTASPLRGADGRLIGASKIARDITAQKRQEAALRDSDERFRLFMDNTPAQTWVTDERGVNRFANNALARALRRPVDEVVGRSVSELLPDLPVSDYLETDQRVLATGAALQTVVTAPREDGTLGTFLVSKFPLGVAPDGLRQIGGVSVDITELRRADEASRKAEERFRRSFELGLVGMALTSPAAGWMEVNNEICRILGYERDELLRMTWAEMTHPDDLATDLAEFNRVLAGEIDGYRMEKRFVRKDGRVVHTNLSVSCCRGGDRSVEYFVALVQDVSDRKRAEESLRASEARFRALVEGSWDGVTLIDATGVIRYATPATNRVFGYSMDEYLGRNGLEFVHPDDQPETVAAFARVAAEPGETATCVYRYRRRDGSWRWVETVVTNRLADPDIGALVLNSRDVTEQRAAQEALHRDSLLLANVRDAVMVTDLNGIVTYWNEGATRIFGWTAPEMVGRPMTDRVPESDRERMAAAARAIHEGAEFAGEWEDWRKDGSRVWIDARVTRITDPDGRAVGVLGVSHDVTERKRSEDALRASEERFRAFMDNSPAVATIKREDGRFLYVNRTWLRLTDPEPTDWLDKTDYDYWPRDVADELRAAEVECLTRNAVVQAEVTTRARDGRTMTWLRIKFPLTDGGRRLLGAIAWDVTEQKRSERAVRASEERYRTLVNATAAIVWDSPASGEFDSDQPAWTAFTGQTREQHKGWGWLDAVHPDDREKSAQAWAAAMRGGSVYQVEHRLRRADGVYREMSVRAVPIFEPNGAIREWVGVHTDVTDKKIAEEALLMRDRAIRAVTQGIVITDPAQPNNPIVYVGPGFERLTGYGQDEVRGRNCRLLQGKDTDPAPVARLREAVRAGRSCTVELLNYRKDGTTFWNELSISPVRDPDGRLTHFVGVQADVTARRSLEEQFRQAQKMEAVGQLAGGVAHDFNNLVTIINGYSDLLLQALPQGDPNRELVGEIHKAGERSAGLTRQLLAFSRQQVLTTRVIDLNAVVVDTEKMLRRLIGEDVRLATKLQTELWSVRADPGQIEQVLLNLAVNARDAMPRGGQLTIETRNVELDDSYARTHPDAQAGTHVLLRVTDTGAGMPPEVRARIFEPFFTTKGPGKGTGLGLATVYGIVKQSGGHVAVESAVGVGTTFEVYLPRTDKPAGESKVVPGLLAPPRGTETILLVEDEDGVRALTRHVLAGCGYTVLEAASGDEAILVAARHAGLIQLLVTDVVMPGLSGRVVSEDVVKRHPEARVLFVSGYTDDAVIRHGVLTEGVNFLQKPFSPTVLAFKVREVLDTPAKPTGS